ncbi:MAG: beta-phosphoglucomutase [Anaerolineae bacterium]|nr:beta-phosphoglucomutase [Anaerolineae bacterium]
MQKRLWSISEYPFQPERHLYYETIFALGNGYLGSRANFEEGLEGQTPATLVHGVYNHAPGMLVPELVNFPNWTGLTLTVDGTPFHLRTKALDLLKPTGGVLLGYKRTLHMDVALLRREALFRAESGGTVKVIFERFVSLADVHVMAQRLKVIAIDGAPRVEILAWIDAEVTNNGVSHWTNLQTTAEADQITVSGKTGQSPYRMGIASRLISPQAVNAASHATQPRLTSVIQLDKDGTVTIDKLTAIYTSRDSDDPLGSAQAKIQEATAIGYDKLYQAHTAAWADHWRDSDVIIEGDEQAQIALRFTMYHVLIAAPQHDDDVSIGAKTLSGFGYKGHVFWDTELFILPPLTLTQPEIARNLLMYRYKRLPGARHKAQANGYEGAMYPWESTDTGEETTPQWSDPQPDGTRIRIWTGDNEQHISTDIAYAIMQYWHWTGDTEFMIRYGAEIVLDTAVFWGSRVELKGDRYELTMQIGPDEYHENINNSVFVNRMTVWHLEQALQLIDWLQQHAPDQARTLTEQLGLTPARLDHWRDVIARMYLPFDAEQQRHIQFDGFFEMEYIPVPHYEPRVGGVWPMLGHHRALQSQVIKQADVVMLMALLGDQVGSREVMLNNWHTYYPRTDHGSSLSPAIHAWVAARLGLMDDAEYMFEHAAMIDLQDNKGNVRDGIHGAASGGLWQAVVFGFCGLTIDHGDLKTDPKLPDHWKSVTFTVYYQGQRRQITVRHPVGNPVGATGS